MSVFFYVDESGNTGLNLFDENQPFFYYGVLSSATELDQAAEPIVRAARERAGVASLHANELGVGGIVAIADYLQEIQSRFRTQFDLHRLYKPDYVLFSFFDQVFDQGLNPAVPWEHYWTPLRYVLLQRVSLLFDQESLKLAWEARINRDSKKAEKMLAMLCATLKQRNHLLPDKRSRQVVSEVLGWASQNPDKLQYNVSSREQELHAAPNIIGFQSVMHGIARRIPGPEKATRITVDRQSQFNQAQQGLAKFYDEARHFEWYFGPGLPRMDLSNIPTVPVTVGDDLSCGLELVDIYLWMFKRFAERATLSPEIYRFILSCYEVVSLSEISLTSLLRGWEQWFQNLPELTEDSEKRARELLELSERRRLEEMSKISDKK